MIVTEEELVSWGRAIGAAAAEALSAGRSAHRSAFEPDEPTAGPTVLLLDGPLGAGKSTLARAVARGAGVTGNLPSPTFNLVFAYEGRGGLPVVHADLYRIESASELDALGWEDLLAEGLVLVEWPQRAEERLGAEGHWAISLRFVPGQPQLREVVVSRAGAAPELEPLLLAIAPGGPA